MNIEELVQKLDLGSAVELFEIDISPITGTNTASDHFYFHAGTNELRQPVVWQGNTYQPFPVQADGFDLSTKGALPRPHLRVANVTGVITSLCGDHEDLVGAKVIRRRTFAMYLDAVNFSGGVNANADPNQHLPDDIYYVERKVLQNKQMVEWELASAMDLEGVVLPARPITVNYCVWQYRSAECGYTGSAYFNILNQSVATLAEDVCSKSITGCKKRFGDRGLLPFGGFPAARAYKF